MLEQHGDRRLGDERPLAHEHFVQHHAQRVHVRSVIDRLARRLLGAHVLGGADHAAGHRQVGALEQPGQAEVGQHHPTVIGGEHVAWLDVAMDHAAGMGIVETRRDLVEEVGNAAVVEANVHQVGQGWTFDVLEDQVWHAALVLAEVVDGDDVRMAQVGGGARFTAEPLHELGGGGEIFG